MMSRHKVSWAWRGAWLDEKLAVGADGLKSVMLDGNRLTRDSRQDER
jgi:hypothetical protein